MQLLFDISVCSYFNAEAVMWAVGATAFVTFGISLFAMQSKVRSVTPSGPVFAAQPKVTFKKLQQLIVLS